MSLLSRFLGESPPGWARPMGSSYGDFLGALTVAIGDRESELALSEGRFALTLSGVEASFDATTLAQLWLGADNPSRNETLRNHLNRAIIEAEALNGLDFASASPHLRVRLDPSNQGDSSPNMVEAINGEVRAECVLRFGLGEVSLDRDSATSWGTSNDEVRTTALDNTYRYEHAHIDRSALGGFEFTQLTGASPFVSTHVLQLDRFIVPQSPHGALVAMPTRSRILFCAIQEESDIGALPFLVGDAEHHYLDDPQPLTPWAYWYYEGQLNTLKPQGGRARPSMGGLDDLLNLIRKSD